MRELDLLQHIYAASRRMDERVRLGPGDDMACLELDGRAVLVAVDQLIAGRHYDATETPVALIGRKAVMRSLSDVAAMAGRPSAALATAALPPGYGERRSTDLFDAMRAAALEYDCPLIGGDIAVLPAESDPLVCTVTVLAEPPSGGAITRGGARIGDTVYVTGTVGGAVRCVGPRTHLSFAPRIDEAQALVGALGDRLHAMIDLSDGLGRDASHIASASGVGIRLESRAVPRPEGLSWRQAASEGEDYELLFTAAGEVPRTLGDGVAVTAIGAVTEAPESGASRVEFVDGAETICGEELGWQHEG